MAQYTVTLNASPAAYGRCEGAGTYDEYSALQIAAIPNEGYNFSCAGNGRAGACAWLASGDSVENFCSRKR